LMNLASTCILAVLLAAPAPDRLQAEATPQPGAPTNVLVIEWVVREVLSNNPSLKAARSTWEAMRSRVPQARAWEDPRVGVDVERSGTTRYDTFTDAEWMVGQQVPLSGRNRWRDRAATAEAGVAQTEMRRRALELLAGARAA